MVATYNRATPRSRGAAYENILHDVLRARIGESALFTRAETPVFLWLLSVLDGLITPSTYGPYLVNWSRISGQSFHC